MKWEVRGLPRVQKEARAKYLATPVGLTTSRRQARERISSSKQEEVEVAVLPKRLLVLSLAIPRTSPVKCPRRNPISVRCKPRLRTQVVAIYRSGCKGKKDYNDSEKDKSTAKQVELRNTFPMACTLAVARSEHYFTRA